MIGGFQRGVGALLGGSMFWFSTAIAAVPLDEVKSLHASSVVHVDQAILVELVKQGRDADAFTQAFELGDALFETVFTAVDGAGANVGEGQRFTRIPRADLDGYGQWRNHFPERSTGPNAQACNQCHALPFDDGAGTSAQAVHRDPLRSGRASDTIRRDTPHLFAPGAIQRLAEEMTETLQAQRDRLARRVCRSGSSQEGRLTAKGVAFGRLTAIPGGTPCQARIDTAALEGVDVDLVVRPFQWKGENASLRDFNRDASHNELGMQAVEIVGDNLDGDFDGVVNELSVGDQTALSIYLAAQPRPVTQLELHRLGLIDPLPRVKLQAIREGRRNFREIGCAGCHKPSLKLTNPVFQEPSANPDYRDDVFPAGQDPVARGVDPQHAVRFDLTRDQPDNIVMDSSGAEVRLGSFERDRQGRAVIRLYGDLKRHDMGPKLAESVDEIGTGARVFLTENLWGVGSTAPYLHDGRATTLAEAILEHGGEAEESRAAFRALSPEGRSSVVTFLENLILFKVVEEEP